MLVRTRTESPKPHIVRCTDLRGQELGLNAIDSRHLGVYGFYPEVLSGSSVGLVGAGALNGEVAEGEVRKGVGTMVCSDGDSVELSNLNRQRFLATDVGKNKAICLADNLQKEGYMGTTMHAYPYYFQEALEKGCDLSADVLVCAVDNDDTRVFVAKYALERSIPVVFSAVSYDCDNGYVFVQEKGGPCFGCAFPEAISNRKTPCPGVPAIKDIMKLVAGFVLYAVDTILMKRRRNWNYRRFHMSGYVPDSCKMIPARSDCPLCGKVRS